MPRKTKSNIQVEETEMIPEMPKLERSSFDDRRASERQTNAKRKIVINDERITKIERKNNPWVEHCKKYAQKINVHTKKQSAGPKIRMFIA